MRKFLSPAVTVVMLILLFGAHHYVEAQSGVPKGSRQKRAALPDSAFKNCAALKNIDFAATNGPEMVSTSSTTFANLPPLAVTFTLPGTVGAGKNCLKVDVSAVTFQATDGPIIIRVLLDGATEFLPNQVQWSGDDSEDANFQWARAHAANFYLPSVPNGAHTVTVQWRTVSAPVNAAFAHWRSLSVMHK
jgi:hypothetical protein